MRLVTVDIGCMRIDERAILSRCQRTHPSNQPFGLSGDNTSQSPPSDFSQWHNPALESYKNLDIWTSASPLPNKPTFVILGSGAAHDEDIASWLMHFTVGDIHIVRIDHWVGGYEHDWTVDSVNS